MDSHDIARNIRIKFLWCNSCKGVECAKCNSTGSYPIPMTEFYPREELPYKDEDLLWPGL